MKQIKFSTAAALAFVAFSLASAPLSACPNKWHGSGNGYHHWNHGGNWGHNHHWNNCGNRNNCGNGNSDYGYAGNGIAHPYDPNFEVSRNMCGGNGENIWDPASGVCFQNNW